MRPLGVCPPGDCGDGRLSAIALATAGPARHRLGDGRTRPPSTWRVGDAFFEMGVQGFRKKLAPKPRRQVGRYRSVSVNPSYYRLLQPKTQSGGLPIRRHAGGEAAVRLSVQGHVWFHRRTNLNAPHRNGRAPEISRDIVTKRAWLAYAFGTVERLLGFSN
jgi:hypothetical protein